MRIQKLFDGNYVIYYKQKLSHKKDATDSLVLLKCQGRDGRRKIKSRA